MGLEPEPATGATRATRSSSATIFACVCNVTGVAHVGRVGTKRNQWVSGYVWQHEATAEDVS